tara:strand:+ start:2353 stop:3345 length:993 start_codon:yes stop_codon:yes gene_type:complete
MKILVTGGSGFIGSNFIINQIKNTDNEILNFDNLTYASNRDNLSSIEKNTKYIFKHGDICDKNALIKTFDGFMPNVIVHFAAESHVDNSIVKPDAFINTNILGTYNLLQISLKYQSKKTIDNFKFIHISTDEVYGSIKHPKLFTEKSPYKPNSPYSASKAASDHLVRSWNKTYKLKTIITNCSNNFGPNQHTEKLIPLVIKNSLSLKDIPIYGDGLNVRDWLYVDDHCDAIYAVIKNGIAGESYNIGGNNQVSNLNIIKKICAILDKKRPRKDSKKYSDLIKFVNDRPGHDRRYAIDFSKISKQLMWKPAHTFDSGIEKTISWYLENKNW